MLEVLEPGLLTSIQDAGRPDWTHLGVPIGGACDRVVARGRQPAGRQRAGRGSRRDDARRRHVRRPRPDHDRPWRGRPRRDRPRDRAGALVPGRSHRLDGGHDDRRSTVTPRARPVPAPTSRCPAASTFRSSSGRRRRRSAPGFGGIDGRRFRPGTSCGPRRSRRCGRPRWPASAWRSLAGARRRAARRRAPMTDPIRLLPGPATGLEAIVAAEWTVGASSDRVGLRLEGPAVDTRRSPASCCRTASSWGAIQVPAGGAPIVLLADHQTTGGYPIAAVVISADHPRLGQLRPGATRPVRGDDDRRRSPRAGPPAGGAGARRGLAPRRMPAGTSSGSRPAGSIPGMILRLSGVSVRRAGRTLLGPVDWSIAAGDRWVVLGPNGSGKTTLVHVASTYLWPTTRHGRGAG